MIQVEMSEDITKYETKIWGSFTRRQLISVLLALLVATPLALLIPHLELTVRIIIFGIVAAPFIFCGYFKADGITAEIFILRFIYRTALCPAKRKLKQTNWLQEGIRQMEEEDEKKKIMKLTPSQQKKYYKKKNDKTIRYSNKPDYKVFK